MPPPSGSHLAALMLQGAEGAASGRLTPEGLWSLTTRGKRSETFVAAIHEYYHFLLNDGTVFGKLLMAVALGAQRGSVTATSICMDLVSYCRITHEAYATFQSVIISGKSSQDVLAAYPRYAVFYAGAALLAGDLSVQSPAGYEIVDAALSECMSAPFQPAFLASGVLAVRPADIPRTHRPDLRFANLRRFLPSKVPMLVKQIDSRLPDWLQTADKASCSDWTYQSLAWTSEQHGQFADLVREQVRGLMAAHGMAVMGDGERAAALDGLRAAIKLDHLEDLMHTDVHEVGFDEVASQLVMGERLLLREQRRSVLLSQDAGLWATSTRTPGIQGLVALIYPVTRFTEQYDVSSTTWAESNTGDRALWILRTAPADEQIHALWVRKYADLDLTLRSLPNAELTTIIALSALPGSDEWWDTWGARLQERSDIVLFSDINVVGFLRPIRDEVRTRFEYVSFRPKEREDVDVLVLDAIDDGYPLIWLGSAVARSIVENVVENLWGGTFEPRLAESDSVKAAVLHIIEHEFATGLSPAALFRKAEDLARIDTALRDRQR